MANEKIFETLKISDVMDMIESRRMYLPAIQSQFVWDETRITRLFDSIMRGYGIGVFSFWEINKTTANENNYALYEFIKNYHQHYEYRNDLVLLPFNIDDKSPNKTFWVALGGQQHLKDLYISIMGSASLKLPIKEHNYDDAYLKKELYFNLLSKKRSDDDVIYQFAFLSKEELKSKGNNPSELWYKVKEILRFTNLRDLNENLIFANKWISNRVIIQNISMLFTSIKVHKVILYYPVKDKKNLDVFLRGFLRVNSGG